MNTTDKIVVTFVTNMPKMKFSAFRNGLLLASGSNAQELGETLRELLAHKRNDGYYLEYLGRRREIIKDIGSAWARLAKTCQ
jgi:hypothetical protein